jgi:hypothetical protein
MTCRARTNKVAQLSIRQTRQATAGKRDGCRLLGNRRA